MYAAVASSVSFGRADPVQSGEAGVQNITDKFEVSEAAAILGVIPFAWGYALGPMVWVGRLAHACARPRLT
ncbi:Caffeine resistance protein 5 [Penicillium soppii]|uniref:Caffeine resistance protein 5 n=1 Tax=Penicillium soppii TaxID=69789 RepID=UPI0025469228|nr:Caffeine resistance protein 5 [Penicillium soppii]KAJ5871142.1 Caffeine resistance protein 5 [Penicillium soppii]